MDTAIKKVELHESLTNLINSFATLQLSNENKKNISVELGKMALLRGESISDYNFELWIEYFTEQGYEYSQIIEIINLGKSLKKFGGNILSIGDLISLYQEKQEEPENLNWKQFFKMLKIYEEKALNDIQTLCGGKHITLDEYHKHKEYLENQFKIKYQL